MSLEQTQVLIEQTRHWLKTLVIGQQFCPFASPVVTSQSIHYCVNNNPHFEQCLHTLIEECLRLNNEPEIATTLIIYPEGLTGFDDFIDFLAIAEELLSTQGYEGIYQLASFHPDYCFNELSPNDPSNFTNRSPYPMLHLLREASIDKALQSFKNPELIPERNIALTRKLGSAKLQAMLTACFNLETS